MSAKKDSTLIIIGGTSLNVNDIKEQLDIALAYGAFELPIALAVAPELSKLIYLKSCKTSKQKDLLKLFSALPMYDIEQVTLYYLADDTIDKTVTSWCGMAVEYSEYSSINFKQYKHVLQLN